jgi:hypothetical protein
MAGVPKHSLVVTRELFDGVTAQISEGPLGLAYHRPEIWAEATRCFQNVARKVRESGGRIIYGWTFHNRFAERLDGNPPYLYVTHHAVWQCPNGELVDVTPYREERHEPYAPAEGSILFLVDYAAKPVMSSNQVAPLPLRFFPIGDDPALKQYVQKLNEEEQLRCKEIYAAGKG